MSTSDHGAHKSTLSIDAFQPDDTCSMPMMAVAIAAATSSSATREMVTSAAMGTMTKVAAALRRLCDRALCSVAIENKSLTAS